MMMSGGAVMMCGVNPILLINPSSSSASSSCYLPLPTSTRLLMITSNCNTSLNNRRDLSFCPSISTTTNNNNNNNNMMMMNINNNNNNNKKRNSVIVMQWQDCKVKMEVQVPVSTAYRCYSDREAIPKWMPFISTVKILEDKPDLSRWSLKYKAFGQDIEFSWLARNMQPIKNQKIHWRSLEGLPNRGAVRFYPKGPSSCTIELTVSYEVPQLLAPVASALQPFLESLLIRGLERFAEFASSYSTDSSR